jgi:hypothetical protein
LRDDDRRRWTYQLHNGGGECFAVVVQLPDNAPLQVHRSSNGVPRLSREGTFEVGFLTRSSDDYTGSVEVSFIDSRGRRGVTRFPVRMTQQGLLIGAALK